MNEMTCNLCGVTTPAEEMVEHLQTEHPAEYAEIVAERDQA